MIKTRYKRQIDDRRNITDERKPKIPNYNMRAAGQDKEMREEEGESKQ